MGVEEKKISDKSKSNNYSQLDDKRV